MKKLKIGLVLGGGGARGLAHIGVLQALQAHGIKIDIIVGTSMGALVGAVYAQHPDADFVERKFRDFFVNDKSNTFGGVKFRRANVYEPEDLLQQVSREIKRRVVINLAAHRKGLFKSERLDTLIHYLVEKGSIEDTTIPFACASVDITKGHEVIFKKGDIHMALSASSAVPGFIPPVDYNGSQLVDGSVCNNFPIEIARELGADIVLAVNVSSTFESGDVDNVVDIIIRASAAATFKLNELALRSADYVITPPIGKIYWTDFEQIDSLIENGMSETLRSIDSVREMVRAESSFIGRLKKSIIKYMLSVIKCR